MKKTDINSHLILPIKQSLFDFHSQKNNFHVGPRQGPWTNYARPLKEVNRDSHNLETHRNSLALNNFEL